ncbi:AMP-binding protein, partial [Nocardia abscessus]|uniref:AMP-binding protein n=1 Tax=Nocardia abscessus TaxID=120957 RepID=UPI002455DBED
LFEQQVEQTPEAVAVIADDGTLTYRELNQRADRLAHHLMTRHGVRLETTVAVALPRSLALITTLLAILKAGANYLPLDPANPPHRTHHMLGVTGASIAFVESRSELSLPDGVTPIGPDVLDELWTHAYRSGDVTADISGATTAYVIFTSGSTGEPKGVSVSHQAISNRIQWMQNKYDIGAADAVLQKTPATFDVSVWEFFWPLIAGARLVLATPGGHREPKYLAEVIAEQQITVAHFVPSMLEAFLQTPYAETVDSIRHLFVSGEALPAAVADLCRDTLPQARLHNLYGPTEAAVDVTFHEVEAGRDSVPIGRPISNVCVYVLGGGLLPVPVGVAGEL